MIAVCRPTTTYKTGYAITPFVGLFDASPPWVALSAKVAGGGGAAPGDLVASAGFHTFQRPEGESLDMPYFPLDEERQVWGATARILDELLGRLAPVIPGAARRRALSC